MTLDRVSELLEPYLGVPDARRMTPDAFGCISTYIDILQRWNSRVNLTAIRDEEQIVTRHFGESFFTARHLFPERNHVGTAALGCWAERSSAAIAANDERRRANNPVTVADVGSGAGFPGIPIKLWAPKISLTLVESNHKKATFLREIVRALKLTGVNIQNVRAESLPSSAFDVVTLRAVERFAATLPIAANLVAPTGRLALLIGATQLQQAKSLLPTASWIPPEPIPTSDSRVLAIATLAR